MTGKVWLVGAGPGDAGLLTRRGYDVLKEADVVVYDSLISDGVLALMPQQAEKIDVGKRAGHHKLDQDGINRVLLQEAEKGKKVVRLKGGDPFLFGRGGEELRLLAEGGIPFEVIPGVTSAISVPAYNGIPVTHRDYVSSVHIITGHKKAGQHLNIDFEALVRTGGTLVFLMGVTAMPEICKGLIEAGMAPSMPAAILQEGTTAGQRRVVATLETLPAEARHAGIGSPGIIVVGEVCRLAEDFAWYEKKTLFGLKVLLTRPKELISMMAEKLRDLGAEVVELPAIRTEVIRPNRAFEDAFKHLGEYNWIAFTSPTGVRIFFEEMNRIGVDIRRLCHMKVAALGEGTRNELRKHGLIADVMPEVYDGGALGRAIAEAALPGEKIFLPRAALGNREIIEALKAFEILDLPIYDTIGCNAGIIEIEKEINEGKIHMVAFTSSSSARAFAAAYPNADRNRLMAACIGRQTMATAEGLGFRCAMAEKATIDSLISLITELKNTADDHRNNQ